MSYFDGIPEDLKNSQAAAILLRGASMGNCLGLTHMAEYAVRAMQVPDGLKEAHAKLLSSVEEFKRELETEFVDNRKPVL